MAAVVIAHLGEGGGGTIVFVLVAVGMVAAGMRMRTRDDSRSAAGWGLILGGVIVGAAGLIAFTASSGSKAPDVKMTITPPTGIEVPAGQPVRVSVEVEGAPVAASADDRSGGHIHVFLDGALQEMAFGTRTTLTFAPGPHTVRFEYVDNRHLSYKPPAIVEATYTAR